MIRVRKTSRWLLVLAFTMRLSSLCWLAVTSIGTGAGMIGTLPKALHYTISFMGHDTSVLDSIVPEVPGDSNRCEQPYLDLTNPVCLVPPEKDHGPPSVDWAFTASGP